MPLQSYRTRLLFCLVVGLTTGVAAACNIPVFRYALERWKADDYELVVFHNAPLSTEDQQWIATIGQATSSGGGALNLVVTKIDTAKSELGEYEDFDAVKAVRDSAAAPYVVVRLESQSRTIDAWNGELSAAKSASLVDSPVRREIAARLLRGHSIIWLMLKSGDAQRDAETAKLLKGQCTALESFIKLPEGIGVPGSELYSEVPLFVKFSFIEIDPNDAQEAVLIHLLSHFHGDASSSKEPLIAPVFGRGRMLEVIPASNFSADLMRDLTMFMSGACSCQVKDRNPGIDLLMARNWDVELFGVNGRRPPSNPNAAPNIEPTLLTIPPGRSKR